MTASYVKALLEQNGTHWNTGGGVGTRQDMGERAHITFSYINAFSNDLDPRNFRNFSNFSPAQVTGVGNAIDHFEEIANISISEVSTGGTVEIGYAQTFFDFDGDGTFESAGGLATRPNPLGSDVVISRDFHDFSIGSTGYNVLLHELGHAVGGFNDVTVARNINQSFAPDSASRNKGMDGTLLTAEEDSNQYTVMSYNDHPDMPGVEARTLMLYDIAALQSLYGANMTTRAGDTTYVWEHDETFIETIWDAGGIDTFDASQQTRSTTLNLNAGGFSSLGSIHGRADAKNNLAIAFNTTIEHAIGGSGDDFIYGNEVDNQLYGNAGDDVIYGLDGSDYLHGGNGNDVLTGVDATYWGAGVGEFDILTGGGGADTFVLGDAYEAFYYGEGYALITDFNWREGDLLSLQGDASNYSLGYGNWAGNQAQDTLIYHQDDIIGLVQDTTSLEFYWNGAVV